MECECSGIVVDGDIWGVVKCYFYIGGCFVVVGEIVNN